MRVHCVGRRGFHSEIARSVGYVAQFALVNTLVILDGREVHPFGLLLVWADVVPSMMHIYLFYIYDPSNNQGEFKFKL